MTYLTLIWTVTIIHLLGCISPGPDFVMAVKNSLTYSRKTGIYTALGFALVAIFFTQQKIRSVYLRFQGVFNKIFGSLLIALGVKVALAER